MSDLTMEQEFEALLQEFSADLKRIDQQLKRSGGRSYRVEGAHVMVGPANPLSDAYFASHGLSRDGSEARG